MKIFGLLPMRKGFQSFGLFQRHRQVDSLYIKANEVHKQEMI